MIWDMQASTLGWLFFDRAYEITKEYFDEVHMFPYERISNFESFLKITKTKAFNANFIHPELSTKPVDKAVEKPAPRLQNLSTIWLSNFCLLFRQ